MKVLWLSKYVFRDAPDVGSGTWVGAIGRALAQEAGIELYNIVCGEGLGEKICHSDWRQVRQWLLPNWKIKRDGLPAKENICELIGLIEGVDPDVVHIWGMESYFGLLISRGWLKGRKCLLDVQGIRFAVGEYFAGNLTIGEQLRCVGLKELACKASPMALQAGLLNAKTRELEMLRSFSNISYQSEWVHDYLKMFVSQGTRLFKTRMALRDEFVEGEQKWTVRDRQNVVFALGVGNRPYKGIHTLVRAIAYLKQCDVRYRNIQLQLGGEIGRRGWLKSGYLRKVEDEVVKYDLTDNVRFLGALTAGQIRDLLLRSAVFVQPSFVESYSLAVAEAMAVGVPCVISNAGALPELAEDGCSALYFPSGDAVLCAERIRRILESDELSARLSENARNLAMARNDSRRAVERQLEIYRRMVA